MNGVEKKESIVVHKARENNLKNIDISIPLNAFTCIVGVSGCGKSSLVYDTIYAESQRSFLEGLSGNMFGQKLMDKPNVDAIENLRPALSMRQNYFNFNPRSTVGTITDISHYLRTLFALITNETQGRKMLPSCFSCNTPSSCCLACEGTGESYEISTSKLIPDPSISLKDGGITFFAGKELSYESRLLEAICDHYSIDINKAIQDLTSEEKEKLIYRSDRISVSFRFKNYKGNYRQTKVSVAGVMPELEEKLKNVKKPSVFAEISPFIDKTTCPKCDGSGLAKGILDISILEKNIFEVEKLSIEELGVWIESVKKEYYDKPFFYQVQELAFQILLRVKSISALKLGYLSVRRSIPSLSGGELQRIRIATQLNCSLTGIVYIFDEPCKGLHFRDVGCIIDASKKLVEKGNTLIAIEHNKYYISNAEKVIELGPQGGISGGYIVRENVPANEFQIALRFKESKKATEFMQFNDICYHNICHQNIAVPIGITTCITGVSGSGKSSFVRVLVDCVSTQKANHCVAFKSHGLKKVLFVDQKPIGKTSRSTIASYLEIYDDIRNCFSSTSEAKKRKISSSFFSMNIEGGRCECCQGTGVKKIQLQYLPDSYIKCPDCEGHRFQSDILEIRFKGKNIDEVLSAPIDEVIEIFSDHPIIYNKLKCIIDMGIGYLSLGRLSMNLSGGEAQRIKLAKVLGTKHGEHVAIILDEPTAGLHERDIEKLLNIIGALSRKGETIIAIEHNVEFISQVADCIIDFGVGSGNNGGKPILFENPIDAFSSEVSSLYYS